VSKNAFKAAVKKYKTYISVNAAGQFVSVHELSKDELIANLGAAVDIIEMIDETNEKIQSGIDRWRNGRK
jgi:hypothetical protein